MPVTFKGKLRLEDAQALALRLKLHLINLGFTKVAICGSVRRLRPEVGDLDLIVDGSLVLLRSSAAADAGIRWVEGGEDKATLAYEPPRTPGNYHGPEPVSVQVNILRTDREHWGAALFYFTGPAGYNIAYRARAKRMGMLLNEKGLFRRGECVASRTEQDIYRELMKVYKDPEDRGT